MSDILGYINATHGPFMMLLHFAIFTVLVVMWRRLVNICDNHLPHIYSRLTRIETQLEEREKK